MTTLKKSLAFVLSLALLLTSLVVPMAIFAETDELDVWDGTFVRPTPNSEGVLEIYTPEEFAWMIKNNGRWDVKTGDTVPPASSFKLMNDIWLNDMLVTIVDGVPTATKASDTSVVIDLTDPENNGLNQWFNEWTDSWFVGNFDGQSHVVNGLYITSAVSAKGLFPVIVGATIKNLGVENAYVKGVGGWKDGIIAGSAQSAKSTITNCYTGLSTYHENTGTGAAILGGNSGGARVSNCYSLTTLKVKAGGGAIVGDSWGNSSMTNCYAYGHSPNRPNYDSPTNCYKFDAAPGKDAFAQATYLGDAFAITDGFPVLKSFTDMPNRWGGFLEIPTDADGDGVLEVYKPAQFAYVTAPGTKYLKAKLMNDIVINDIDVVVTDGVAKVYDAAGEEITDFSGLTQWHTGQTVIDGNTIDGDGHTVRGIFSTYSFASGSANNQGIGLVNKGWNVHVKNLHLSDMYLKVTGGTAAGIVANIWGQKYNNVTSCLLDESCYIEGNHASGVWGCGGAVTDVSTISKTAVLAYIKANGGKAGGFTGDIWSCGNWKLDCSYTKTNFFGNNAMVTSMSYEKVGADKKGSAAQSLSNLRNFALTKGYPVPEVFAENPNVWGGFVAGSFAGGEGTEENPYLISNGGEFARALSIAGGDTEYFFKLTNDIYLNDLAKVDWKTGTVADGYAVRNWYKDTAVYGTFIGDGHVVYGMYYNTPFSTNWGVDGSVALFPRIKVGETLNISGIGVDKSYVQAIRNAAGFVGSKSANNETVSTLNISECYVGADVLLKSYLTGSAIAGLRCVTANISDFYALDTQIAHSNSGIAADAWGGTANMNRVFHGNGTLSTKGATASNGYATGSASKAGVVMSADSMQGEKALVTMYGLGDKFLATESFPVLKIFAENYDESLLLGKAPFEGAGTEEDPYLISNGTDLYNMVALGGQGAYYELTNDIYVNDVGAVDWATGTVNEGYNPTTWFVSTDKDGKGYLSYISTKTEFKGTVDGKGYAIHGIYYEYGNSSTLAGLVPYANNATFKNLGIEDSFIGGGRFTGGFVGYGNTINLSNCWVDESVAVWGWDAGAAYVTKDSDIHTSGGAGLCLGKVDHYEYAEDENGTYKLEGDKYVAIAEDEEYDGTRYSISDTVWANADFTSEALGGLVGRFITGGTIENCYVTGDVQAVAVRVFGTSSEEVKFANDNSCGASAGHMGYLWGDDWNATVNATNCFSVGRAHENNITTGSNLYTLAAGFNDSRVTVASLSEATGLTEDNWYFFGEDGLKLNVRGEVLADVNLDGQSDKASDVTALRVAIISGADAKFADRNGDSVINVLDLVALSK